MEQYRDKLLQILIDLIENKEVNQFYSGFRGDFDRFCSSLIHELKECYPQIKNTLVLSYIPDGEFILHKCFDDSIYLLERRVPKRFAIIETNKCLVDKVDYIVAGVITHCGGAYAALEYANKRKKPIINMIDGWEVCI
ncbi:MAG: hypothetical protein K2L12_00245 [Clostridia bacterium]|nr:hypothetical protein [Clostridia bacterium]